LQGSLKPTGKPCKKLIHRKGENMDNTVEAMGMEVECNFFTTVNTLLHEKLVYAETMIKHLRFIGELVDEKEASILGVTYGKESIYIKSIVTDEANFGSEPDSNEESTFVKAQIGNLDFEGVTSIEKLFFDQCYGRIYKLYVSLCEMPEVKMIEFCAKHPNIEVAEATQQMFCSFCDKEKELVTAYGKLIHSPEIFEFTYKFEYLASLRSSEGDNSYESLIFNNQIRKIDRIKKIFLDDLLSLEENSKTFPDAVLSLDEDSQTVANLKMKSLVYLYGIYYRKVAKACEMSSEEDIIFTPSYRNLLSRLEKDGTLATWRNQVR
jgi:hypothetical protein